MPSIISVVIVLVPCDGSGERLKEKRGPKPMAMASCLPEGLERGSGAVAGRSTVRSPSSSNCTVRLRDEKGLTRILFNSELERVRCLDLVEVEVARLLRMQACISSQWPA